VLVFVALGEHAAQVARRQRAQLAVAQERFLAPAHVEEHVEAHGRLQSRAVVVGRRHRVPEAVEQVVERAVEDGEQDVLLGREVVVEAGRLHPQPAGERPHRAAVIAARAKERGRRAQDARGGGPFRSGGDEGGAHTYLTFVRHAIHGGPTVKAARGGRRDPLRCRRSNAAAGGRSWRCWR